MATDRDTATTLTSILEAPFDKLWLPLNRGTDDSWGALLNENFETIVRTFVHLDDRLTLNAENIDSNELLASEGVARSLQNQSSIQQLNSAVSDLAVDLTDVRVEVATARGNASRLDDRFDVSFDDDGIRKAPVIMSGIFTVNYIRRDVTYNNVASILDITSELSGESSGDGSDYGLISAEASQPDSEADNVCHIVTGPNEAMFKDGRRVYGRLVHTGGIFQLRTYVRDSGGSEQPYTVPSGTSVSVYLPKLFDYYTTPAIDVRDNKEFSIPKATSSEYGIVKMGDGNGLDADTVDGIHASTIRQSGVLYPLNDDGDISANTVKIQHIGINEYLETFAPKLLKSRAGEIDKDIDYYIGEDGFELFPTLASGDLGAHFTKTIDEIETAIDQYDADITDLYECCAVTTSGYLDNRNIYIPVAKADAMSYTDTQLSAHEGNTDAHHDSLSTDLDIMPRSVSSVSGSFEYANIIDAFITNLTVTTTTYLQQQDLLIEDRFIECGVLDSQQYTGVSGIPDPTISIINSSGIPDNDQYKCGILLHHPDIYTDVSGIATEIVDQVAMIRYNDEENRLEYTEQWIPPSGTSDENEFKVIGISKPSETFVVFGRGIVGSDCDYYNPQDAIDNLPTDPTYGQWAGKIVVRKGEYTDPIVLSSGVFLEGCGYHTKCSTIIVSGNFNMISKLKADTIILASGVAYNNVSFNWIDTDIQDDSGNSLNNIFGNIPF